MSDRRRLLCAVVLAGAVVIPVDARGQRRTNGTLDACIEASESAQRERARGRLRNAREATAGCLDDRCPTAIRRDCGVLAAELERLVPSIVVRVRAPDGSDVPGASISIDGTRAAEAVDGRARDIDPGPHDIVVAADGFAPARSRIVVEEGIRSRLVELRLERSTTSAATSASDRASAASGSAGSRPTSATWIASGALAGLGFGGLTVFAGFALSADADFRRLRDTCGTSCPQDDGDSVRSRFQLADVALGVGLVALASAVVVYLVGPRTTAGTPETASSRVP